MKGVTALRRLALLRVAAALVVIMTGLTSYLASSSVPAQAAPPKLPHLGTPLPPQAYNSDDILFIHGFAGGFPPGQGYGSTQTVPGGCEGATTWGTAIGYFRSQGWAGSLRTVGYYRGDWQQNGYSCNIQFDSQAPVSQHQYNCDNYPSGYGDANEGSNNQDLGNIACQLAWYIYNTYTTAGRNVRVIAHSMGGMIIRYALDRVFAQDPAFPPYLYVPTVVTIATPHGGVPSLGAAWFECGKCTMISNIQQNAGSPSYFINELLGENIAPMGSPGEPTQWTLMGSACEDFLLGTGVDPGSSLQFPISASGYPAVHKIEYYVVPSQQNDGCDDPDFGGAWQPDYYHGDYLTDQNNNQDATANTCDNCSFPPNNQAMVYHSLHLAYQNTAISIPAAPSYPVVNQPWGADFLSKWWQMGGVNGSLGDPTDGLYSVQSGSQLLGWAQDFQHGSIYWSSATGTYEVQNGIYNEYTSVLHCPNCVQGFPTSDELQVKNGSGTVIGAVSYFYGNLCNGRGPNNSGSAIYWSSPTGSHLVGGCIYNKYWSAYGGPSGNSNYNLGFPTTDVTPISGGYVSYFYGNLCGARGPNNSGSAVYSSTLGTYMVGGCIYQRYWRDFGGPGGNSSYTLGYPVSDVTPISGGYVSYFAGQGCTGALGPNNSGTAVYSSPSGTYEVQGCIYGEYVHAGGSGYLGFPLSDEQGVAGGRVSYFAGQGCTGTGGPYGSGSAVFYTYNTLAHEVQGCIYGDYEKVGGPGYLGFPTTDEQGVAGGRVSYFAGQLCGSGGPNSSGSAVYYTSSTLAHEVQGCIYQAYINFGGPASALGFPVSDEYTNSAGQRESDFQGGYIIWWNNQAYINLNGVCC